MLITGFIWLKLTAQNEFEIYPNGFIYSDQTMLKLHHIVDSLNLKYKSCNLNQVYYSPYQTFGHIIVIDSTIKEAQRDIDKGIGFEKFLEKYPHAQVRKNTLIVKQKYDHYYQDAPDIEMVFFREHSLKEYFGGTIIKENKNDLYHHPQKNSWLHDYHGDYTDKLVAFYFPEAFQSQPLKAKYAQQIGYADCLIDTLTPKLKKDAQIGKFEKPEDLYCLSKIEKTALLEQIRSIEVIGYCSMDSKPRQHAATIAMLSAETANWEVFLKSHLDIMNDHFVRASDGDYAWGRRKTYIKELETLDINVVDLLFGIALTIENAATNHYYGSVGRIGRAIAESKDKDFFKQQLLQMISDNELDYHNRLQMYKLCMYLNYYNDNTAEQETTEQQLLYAVASLPNSLLLESQQKSNLCPPEDPQPTNFPYTTIVTYTIVLALLLLLWLINRL